jgi:hypothetical protein
MNEEKLRVELFEVGGKWRVLMTYGDRMTVMEGRGKEELLVRAGLEFAKICVDERDLVVEIVGR